MMYKLLEPTPEYLMNQDINSISTQIADLNALAEFNAKVKLFFLVGFTLACLSVIDPILDLFILSNVPRKMRDLLVLE